MSIKEDESKPAWVLELGFYPGFLIGIRSYVEKDAVTHVLYIPFFDVSLTVFK
jgi:hypothetical protein